MYKFIRERHQEYAITENDIREVEERFGIVFPKVLRDFYLEYNGDSIKDSCFSVNGNEYTVDDMHYIKIKGRPSVEFVLQLEREDGYIPSNLVAFAYDCGGESYYWSMDDGKVYFIDTEEIENIIFVCDSIEEFFKLLEEAEPF